MKKGIFLIFIWILYTGKYNHIHKSTNHRLLNICGEVLGKHPELGISTAHCEAAVLPGKTKTKPNAYWIHSTQICMYVCMYVSFKIPLPHLFGKA